MDLESDLSEEKKKDEESIKDTLNECKNEVGNIGSELMFLQQLTPLWKVRLLLLVIMRLDDQ